MRQLGLLFDGMHLFHRLKPVADFVGQQAPEDLRPAVFQADAEEPARHLRDPSPVRGPRFGVFQDEAGVVCKGQVTQEKAGNQVQLLLQTHPGFIKTIILWDVASGQPLRTLSGSAGIVLSVAFSPNGRTLASGSQDTTIILWDITSGKSLRTLSGDTSNVDSVSFSPDGKMLASGSWDLTVRLWGAAP